MLKVSIPIDPEDPLGFVPAVPEHDDATRACMDFHYTLAWVFWRTAMAKEGGSFEHVRHLRNIILSGIENRGCSFQKVRTPEYDYDVEIESTSGFIGIIIHRVHAEVSDLDEIFSHVLVKLIIDDKAITDAIALNKDLQEVSTASPFGIGDVVQPGNFDHKTICKQQVDSILLSSGKPLTRTIRLSPLTSDAYSDGLIYLSKASDVGTIQSMLGVIPIRSMTSSEFNLFVHLMAAKTHRLTKESS